MSQHIYTVIQVADLGTVRIRRDHRDTCEPEVDDIVFLNGLPVAKVLVVNDVGNDVFDVTFDRNAKVLIANLLVIGLP